MEVIIGISHSVSVPLATTGWLQIQKYIQALILKYTHTHGGTVTGKWTLPWLLRKIKLFSHFLSFTPPMCISSCQESVTLLKYFFKHLNGEMKIIPFSTLWTFTFIYLFSGANKGLVCNCSYFCKAAQTSSSALPSRSWSTHRVHELLNAHHSFLCYLQIKYLWRQRITKAWTLLGKWQSKALFFDDEAQSKVTAVW